MRLLRDGPATRDTTLAVTRAIMRTNPQIRSADALQLASFAVRAAKANALDPRFFCATLLQESAFDPRAMSFAGAVGIAQFELETADGMGVDAFDPYSSIDGAARLLASYVRDYRGSREPYALALAAYNAGPGAVAYYRGVPPYHETREYIGDIFERWSRIVVYEFGTGQRSVRRIGKR